MNYEQSVRTSTGQEFEIRFMGSTTIGMVGILYIEIIGRSMMDIVSVFSNPAETALLQGLINGNVEKQYRGYINLTEAIFLNDTGNIRIALTTQLEVFGQ